ncbi:MAG: cyclic pyranopterin monophosphate synthase MoaC [Candidatus Caldarchaeum sp.]|nr:cyclic pyranopterin monophosphate synthase MoaC [Candidatus Caldarchaeum sp.]MDW7978348.1 cyclic pyranopterin monophosphate synthase MoaC [Candidatus Caldarchaeum sp.]MDW8359573.1 cyclic pyranopterin monophosphate synthase MoaC [Candidatus Caldarchaeum sp.]
MSIRQVDVSWKPVVRREAEAVGRIRLRPETISRIREASLEKGDALQLARVGGIIGAKSTPLLLPLCHPLKLENVEVSETVGEDFVEISAKVVASEKTGVEMEALTAVSTALLNIWDVVKQYEKDENGQYPTTEIYGVRVVSKVKAAEAPSTP